MSMFLFNQASEYLEKLQGRKALHPIYEAALLSFRNQILKSDDLQRRNVKSLSSNNAFQIITRSFFKMRVNCGRARDILPLIDADRQFARELEHVNTKRFQARTLRDMFEVSDSYFARNYGYDDHSVYSFIEHYTYSHSSTAEDDFRTSYTVLPPNCHYKLGHLDLWAYYPCPFVRIVVDSNEASIQSENSTTCKHYVTYIETKGKQFTAVCFDTPSAYIIVSLESYADFLSGVSLRMATKLFENDSITIDGKPLKVAPRHDSSHTYGSFVSEPTRLEGSERTRNTIRVVYNPTVIQPLAAYVDNSALFNAGIKFYRKNGCIYQFSSDADNSSYLSSCTPNNPRYVEPYIFEMIDNKVRLAFLFDLDKEVEINDLPPVELSSTGCDVLYFSHYAPIPYSIGNLTEIALDAIINSAFDDTVTRSTLLSKQEALFTPDDTVLEKYDTFMLMSVSQKHD